MSGIIKILVLLIFYYPFSNIAAATTIEGMHMVGKGEAYYLKFIKVYDATLYSRDVTENINVLSADVSKCLHLEYAVGVGADDFITAANDVLNRQFSPEQLNRVEKEIEILHGGYEDVEKGDSYTLCYLKTNRTTSLALNGAEVVSVSSPLFAEIYFSIWLGKKSPLDEKLRNNLLKKIEQD